MAPNPLNFKQRLAALAAAHAPSSPTNFDEQGGRPPVPRRRPLFSPISPRRSTQDGLNGGMSEDQLQDILGRVIFQAGVDYETRPMVVMSACALPDPKEVDYDLLLSRILAYLDLYVESDYTVVFFAAGGRHTPGWNWVWKAYRSLSRKYRKNLKRLFIVHSNFFTKMLFSLAGAIISPKFFRKITYVTTLTELAYQVPITQIDIPPAVYQENLKYEKQISLPVPQRADLFGVPLEELMGYDGEKGGIPRVVKDCIQYLRETGLQDEGLFRRSPSSALLKQVQAAYDRGHVVTLNNYGDPHLAAVLLKKYLRDLPEPLFPESLYSTIAQCPTPTTDATDMASVQYIREVLLPSLPFCAYLLLSSILQLLHEVSLQSAYNRMDAFNLAIVITPNLVKGRNPAQDIAMCLIPRGPALSSSSTRPFQQQEGKTTLGQIIHLSIQRYYEIFDDIPDRTEALASGAQEVTIDHARQSFPPPPMQSPNSYTYKRDSTVVDDDEDIDDAMLVMPLGPNTAGARAQAAGPPSAWAAAQGQGPSSSTPGGAPPYKPRQRPPPPSSVRDARSVHTGGAAPGAGTLGRSARSMISIEKGSGTVRRGSIAIGRGTAKKSSGSSVEAMGITASGFFAPPPSAPPVPTLPGR